jgi:hypothetical protein
LSCEQHSVVGHLFVLRHSTLHSLPLEPSGDSTTIRFRLPRSDSEGVLLFVVAVKPTKKPSSSSKFPSLILEECHD